MGGRGGPLERVRQQQVAREHAHGVPPHAAGRRRAPALLSVIDHVIMEQRGEVDELGHDGQVPRGGGDGSEAGGREQDRQRAHTLASRLEQMRRRIRRGLAALPGESRKLRVDDGHVLPQEVVDLGNALGGASAGSIVGGDLAEQSDGREGGARRGVQNNLKAYVGE